MSLFEVKIFISYSRKDEEFAKFLHERLTNLGYNVFLDKEKILIGDDFLEKIKTSIKSIDATVFILSDNSLSSEWCKAEAYYSMALGKDFLPLRYKLDQNSNPDPFVKMQSDINYIDIKNDSEFPIALDKIVDQLTATKKSVQKRVMTLCIKLLGVFLLLGALSYAVMTNINDWNHTKKRNAQINKIKTSSKVFNKQQLAIQSDKYIDDNQFQNELNAVLDDNNYSNEQRVNSLLLLNSIHTKRNSGLNKRWYLDGVDLSNNTLKNDQLANISWINSDINNLQLQNVNLYDFYWGGTVDNSTLDNCRLMGSTLALSIVKTDFRNCQFMGCNIDIENMGTTHFYFENSDSTSASITNELALFENCVITNCEERPGPNVIEILYEDSEVRFSNVLFENCKFKGFIREKWFTDCIFSNCYIPTDCDTNILLSNGNKLQNVLSINESCF